MTTLFHMFIPQANEISPVFVGVNSMSTGSFSGNARLTLRDGTTTSVAQVLSVVRVNVRRAGAQGDLRRLGSCYQQVTCRIAAWLDEAAKAYAGRTILAIGHRATFYALEHLIKGVSLHEAVMSAWRWQPGWMYELTPGLNHAFQQRSKVVTN